MAENRKNLRPLALSILVLLALFGVVIGGFFKWHAWKQEKNKGHLYLWLHADGSVAHGSAGNIITPDSLRKVIRKHASSNMVTINNYSVSDRELHIRADGKTVFYQLKRVLDEAEASRIYKINLAELDEDKWSRIYLHIWEKWPVKHVDKTVGKPIIVMYSEDKVDMAATKPKGKPQTNDNKKAGNTTATDFIPSAFDSNPVVDLGEVQVELLWCGKGKYQPWRLRKYREEFDDYMEAVKDGYVIVRIGKTCFQEMFGKTVFSTLYKHLEKCKTDYVPTRPGKTMPVLIDAQEMVSAKYILRVLQITESLGLKDVSFAPREIGY